MKNKKGASMTGWSEGILLAVLFVLVLATIITNFNQMYGGSNNLGLGTNTTKDAFVDYQDTLSSEIKGGEADFESSSGLTLKSSWGIIKTGMSIIWDFLTGGWIETIVNYMHAPSEVALIFRILYFLSIGFIILKLLFKVKP